MNPFKSLSKIYIKTTKNRSKMSKNDQKSGQKQLLWVSFIMGITIKWLVCKKCALFTIFDEKSSKNSKKSLKKVIFSVFQQNLQFFPGGARESEKSRFFPPVFTSKNRQNFRKSIKNTPFLRFLALFSVFWSKWQKEGKKAGF